MKKGEKMSKEAKLKIKNNNAKYWLGKKRSQETRRKISYSKKIYFSKHPEAKKRMSEFRIGKKASLDSRLKMSKALRERWKNPFYKNRLKKSFIKSFIGRPAWNKGKSASEETKKKTSDSNKGRFFSLKTREKMSYAQKGEKGSNWQGGITPINEQMRKSLEYKLWRKIIFKRDDYTCQMCGRIGGMLHANHIKCFSNYPLLRFDIKNGITLCKKCHLGVVTRKEREWENFFINKLAEKNIYHSKILRV